MQPSKERVPAEGSETLRSTCVLLQKETQIVDLQHDPLFQSLFYTVIERGNQAGQYAR